jgi:uncharacterized protein (TIGR02145 family)
MKRLFLFLISIAFFNEAFSQSTYVFTGNGFWTLSSNWRNNTIPPSILPAGSAININPQPGDSCVLNTAQTISPGAYLIISAGANFIINGTLNAFNADSVFIDSRDGEQYTSRRIGSQTWMTKNLNYAADSSWVFMNKSVNGDIYGRLYNWQAAIAVPPAGWHLPVIEEWQTLVSTIGNENTGGKMKSVSPWLSPNAEATNSSGFSGLGGGLRYLDGTFNYLDSYGMWWSASQDTSDATNAHYTQLFYNGPNLSLTGSYPIPSTNVNPKTLGYSVRCVKNEYPIVSTNPVVSVTNNSAATGGKILNDIGSAITARGVCWGTNPNPTTLDAVSNDLSGMASFSNSLTNLLPNTVYYVKAFAANALGTGYGNEIRVSTYGSLPTVKTKVYYQDTAASATCGSTVLNEGGFPVTATGICWSNTAAPTILNDTVVLGTGIGSFSSLISFTPATTYYARAFATNAAGTNYGEEISFTTIGYAPRLYISGIISVTQNSATVYGEVVPHSASLPVISRGVCWSTIPNPTIYDAKTNNGSGTGSFNTNITGLLSNIQYYVRAYVITNPDTVYSKTSIFTTAKNLPQVTTQSGVSVSTLTSTSAVSGGTVATNNSYTVLARGVCWSATNTVPTTDDNVTNEGSGFGTFTSVIGVLAPSTRYYVRAYAINNSGIGYGSVSSFTTPATPVVTTTPIDSIATASAITGGNVTNEEGTPVTARGVCFATTAAPTIGNSKTIDGSGFGSFNSRLTGLIPNTTYYARAYATNSAGTSYGNQVSFTTLSLLPALITTSITTITQDSAASGGTITYDGTSPVIARGICWSVTTNPTIANNKTIDGSSSGSFTSSFGRMLPNLTYYVRAYATNSSGTGYGNQISITNQTPDSSFTDPRDGQVYTFKHIGTQVWMTKNLNYTPPDSSWCYNDSSANCAEYGRLYSWRRAVTVAPPGWHLPSDAEWRKLINNLGGGILAGPAMGEAGTAHFNPPNSNSTNSSGFTGLPGGQRYGFGPSYTGLKEGGTWWTGTTSTSGSSNAYTYVLQENLATIYQGSLLKANNACSVRYVRD